MLYLSTFLLTLDYLFFKVFVFHDQKMEWSVMIVCLNLSVQTPSKLEHTFLCFPVFFFKKYILSIMLLQFSHFPPFTPLHPAHAFPLTFSPFSSCPWVIHISSLASTLSILFLPSPCLFSTYHLCYLFSVPFLPLSPSQYPIDNPPCDVHFCGSL